MPVAPLHTHFGNAGGGAGYVVIVDKAMWKPGQSGNPKGSAPPITGRWKPGQSGNPKGRPKRNPPTPELLQIFAKLATRLPRNIKESPFAEKTKET